MHDVVSCPESEYPSSHTGTQLAPDASSVSPAHVPAAALSGFVSFGYVAAVHAFAAHVESVTWPAAEHDVSPDSVYPLAHTGVHDVPAASVPSSQLPFPVPRVGVPVPVAKDTVQSFTHVESVTSPAAEQVVSPESVYPLSQSGVHDSPGPSVPSLQLSRLLPVVPRVGLPVPVAKDTVQPTHVATVNSPAAEHEDVVTPDNS